MHSTRRCLSHPFAQRTPGEPALTDLGRTPPRTAPPSPPHAVSRVLRASLAAALVVVLCAPALAAQGPLDVLREIAAALRSRPVLTAAYVQEYVPAGMTLGEEERGTLTLAWPDRALFVTGDPPVRLMGLDGRRVRLVDLEVSSCEDHTLSEAEWERIPLVAVLDPARAVERFTVTLTQGWLVLVPREPEGLARVRVLTDVGGLPSEVVVEDVSGAVNRFRFTGWKAAPVPANGWLPTPPAGLECIDDAP